MQPNILTDPLRDLYNEMREKTMPEYEAKMNNITAIFWESCETRIDAGECINMQFRGDPASGKSTCASAVMEYVMYKLLKKDIENLDKLIFSDQLEFIRWIKQGQTNICIQIDEWNRMIETGHNATTEKTLFDYYSDVFAQRFVHRISCSPSEVVDRNCYLFLDIEGKDMDQKITRCKATYRDVVTGSYLVIGYVDIDVSGIIKRDWYQKYRKKKFDRMTLLEQNGVRDVRELEFAYITLKSIRRLIPIAKTGKVDPVIINKSIDMTRREEGRIYSIVTMNEIMARCKGLLDTITRKYYTKKLIEKSKNQEEKEELIKGLKEINKLFEESLIDETRLRRIYRKYVNIE